jgi:hypothetical protein
MICPTDEAKYFCNGDWTGRISLIRFNKLAAARKSERRDGTPWTEKPRSVLWLLRAETDNWLSTQVNLLARHFGLFAAPLTRGRTPMEYKGVEYSVVQLTDGIGWRWEIRLGDGKHKSGSTPVSRAVAVKQAEQEIDRILKSGK